MPWLLCPALLVALSGIARAGSASSDLKLEGGSIHWAFHPPHLVLGRDVRASMELTVLNLQGQPSDAEDLHVVASTGRVDKVEHMATGRYRASYRPAAVGFPHVVLFMARARTPDGMTAGAGFFPLFGQGQLRVDTTPDALVTLRVGSEDVGPLAADSDGTAVFDIVAPPGVATAHAESVDAAGNRTRQSVDLGVPAFNRHALFALHPAVAGGQARLLILAVDTQGQPLVDGNWDVSVEGDRPFSMHQVRPGVWLVETTAPERIGTGRMKVHASLSGKRAPGSEALVSVMAGPPHKAEVHLSRLHQSVGDRRPVQVTVRVTDAHGNVAAMSGTKLTVSAGTLTNVTHQRGSVLRAMWRSPAVLLAERGATVQARDEQGHVLGSASLSLSIGGPLRLALGKPARVDGSPDLWLLRAVAEDEHGSRVPHAPLSVSSPDGVILLEQQPQPDGAVLLKLRVPTSRLPGTARLSVRTHAGAAQSAEIPVRVQSSAWFSLMTRPQLHWNFGRLLLVGAGVDSTLGVLLPLPQRWPITVSLVASAATAGSVALPVRLWSVTPLALRRLLLTVPAMAFLGADLRLSRFSLQLGLGGGLSFAQVRLASQQQHPLALLGFSWLPLLNSLGSTARLHAVGPMLAARLAAGVDLGPGVLAADLRLEAPLYLGTALQGFSGGLVLGLGYGLRL
jgi:hypothetical protein